MNSLRIIAAFSLIAISPCLVLAEPVTADQTDQEIKVCDDILVKPLLYKAEKDGKVTYLLGTHHMGISLDRFPKSVKDRIDASDVLVSETGKPKTWIGEAINFFYGFTSSFRFSGPKLSESLSPEAFAKLKALLVDKKIPEFMVDLFSPAGATMMLSFDRDCMKKGALDTEIQNFAKSCNLKIKALEKTAAQVKMMKNLFTIENLEKLLMTVDKQVIEVESKKIDDRIVEGNAAAYEERYQQMAKDDPKSLQVALVERNQAWITKIKKFHDSKKIHFVIVGAMHLPGDQGVLKLLEREGFKITRESFD